jgi:hypothetical protein
MLHNETRRRETQVKDGMLEALQKKRKKKCCYSPVEYAVCQGGEMQIAELSSAAKRRRPIEFFKSFQILFVAFMGGKYLFTKRLLALNSDN